MAQLEKVIEPAVKPSEAKPEGTKTTTTTTTTQPDQYKTEFVKTYQDAGVVGVGMLTLLVICVLLALLTFRVVKMYSNLVTARDALDASRVNVIEKLTENILGIRGEIATNAQALNSVRSEILRNRDESSRSRDAILAENRRVCDRLDRLMDDLPPRERGNRRGS
jgi:hypothetical protein